MVQESITGTAHVAFPASANAFMKQANAGSVYAEFAVPMSSLRLQTKLKAGQKYLDQIRQRQD